MKKIETELHYPYSLLFDVEINKEKLTFEAVGRDEAGNLILHCSETHNRSSAYYSYDDYYILTTEEALQYAAKARKNKLLSRWRYRKMLKELLNTPQPKQGKIGSFQSVLLRTSGMRGTVEQEILMKGADAEVSQYMLRYNGEEKERVLMEQAVCREEEVLRLLNDCGVLSWDGFYGPHPKGVLDGIMFDFDATVNGEETIHAHGSQNFPKHYRDFTDGLYKLLNPSN